MSAFAALIHFDGKPPQREDLERMARALALPEAHGSGLEILGGCGMVFHLNPFTPEDRYERQPLADPSGRFRLLADARIDNRDELLFELRIDAEQAKTLPESQLLLKAFLKWGHDCPRRLVGDFAFCVWDNQERRLFCACDPSANRTLLYYRRGTFFAIATSVKGLHALPLVPKQLRENALLDFLTYHPIESGETLFEDLQRVPSGCTLSVSPEQVQVRRFWTPSRETLRLPNDDAYRDAFLELFEKAVNARLRSISPIGIAMSGGLDSSSIAAIAARTLAQRQERLTGFTLVHWRSFDPGVCAEALDPEIRYVEALKAMYPNLDGLYIPGKEDPLLFGLEDDFEQAGMPPHSVPFQRRHRSLLPEVKSRGIRVLLNGYFGNITLSHSGSDFLFRAFVTGRWRALLHGLRALEPLRKASWHRLFRQYVLFHFYPDVLDPLFRRFQPGKRMTLQQRYGISGSIPVRARPNGLSRYLRQLEQAFDPRHPRESLFIDSITNNAIDRPLANRAQFGIEDRDPSTDQRLIQFCLSLPMEQFIRKDINRFLIRNAMKGILPESIRRRAFFLPREADFGERFEAVREQIQTRLLQLKATEQELPFLDFERLDALLRLPAKELARKNYDPVRFAMRAVLIGEFSQWVSGSNR